MSSFNLMTTDEVVMIAAPMKTSPIDVLPISFIKVWRSRGVLHYCSPGKSIVCNMAVSFKVEVGSGNATI